MASFTLSSQYVYVPSSNVFVYPANARLDGNAPTGDAVTSAVVDSNGTVTFTGLTADTPYVAYAVVSGAHRYIAFRTDVSAGGVEEDDDSAYAELAGADFTGSVSVQGTGFVNVADFGLVDVRKGSPGYAFKIRQLGDNNESLRVAATGQMDWLDSSSSTVRASLTSTADGLTMGNGNLRFAEGKGIILEDTATADRYRVAVTNGSLTVVGPL